MWLLLFCDQALARQSYPIIIIKAVTDCVFSCSILFELLPGGAAVVSSLGVAVVSSVATWNKTTLTLILLIISLV